MTSRPRLPLVFLAVLLALPALAGQRPFIWGWGTDLVPEGDLELEQWLWFKSTSPGDPSRPSLGYVWWAPVFGLTEHLELQVPFQLKANRDATHLDYFEAALHYRVRPRSERGGLQTLFRVAYQHAFLAAQRSRVDAHAVVSWQGASGVLVNLDLGSQLAMPFLRGDAGPLLPTFTYDLGVALPLGEAGEWQVGAEAFGEIPLFRDAPPLPHVLGEGLGRMHHFVGPTVGVTRGRIWATLGVLIGLTPFFPDTPVVMPRFIWAVVL